MLKITRAAPCQTASLSACGDAVMLELEDGDGHAFRQALDARAVGKVLSVCNTYSDEESVCQGDLRVAMTPRGLGLTWPRHGENSMVLLEPTDMFVFEEALKSYCRMLMRPKGDET